MTVRTGLLLAAIVGAGVLAYQVGARLSDDAIMTIVGVLCGIVAMIPISLGLLVALTRERSRYVAAYQPEPEPSVWIEPDPAPYSSPVPALPMRSQPTYPQVLLVAPPQTSLPANYLPYLQGNSALPPPIERDFKIVGDEDDPS